MDKQEVVLDSELLFEGKIVKLLRDRVRLPDGQETVREVVRHRGAVAIVPLDEDAGVWFVRQFRHAPGQELLELPAGKLEPGEQPEETARRELLEEIGARASKWTWLAQFYTSPGFSDELLTVFLAEGLTFVAPGDRPHVEGEFLEYERWSLDEAVAAVSQGRLVDAKTIAGILLALAVTRRRQAGDDG